MFSTKSAVFLPRHSYERSDVCVVAIIRFHSASCPTCDSASCPTCDSTSCPTCSGIFRGSGPRQAASSGGLRRYARALPPILMGRARKIIEIRSQRPFIVAHRRGKQMSSSINPPRVSKTGRNMALAAVNRAWKGVWLPRVSKISRNVALVMERCPGGVGDKLRKFLIKMSVIQKRTQPAMHKMHPEIITAVLTHQTEHTAER